MMHERNRETSEAQRNHVMARTVTVKDDEGQALTLADFGPGVEVKFHVKRGKMDELIVILPR